MLVTGGSGKSGRLTGTVAPSAVCYADIDLTFKKPTLMKRSETKVCDLILQQSSVLRFALINQLVDKEERRKSRGVTYLTGRCGPRWAGYRRLYPLQNGLPE